MTRMFGLISTLLLAVPLHAQLLRGTVRDSVSGRPVPGAVVILLDSAGGTLQRHITNERGEYSGRRPAALRQLRVVRIGFRPASVRVSSSALAVQLINVTMVPTLTMLEAVRVSGGARCPPRSDRGAALALLEQARAGLLNTIVAREAYAARMLRLQFTRELTDSGAIVKQEVAIIQSDAARASYTAERTGTEFVQVGFRRDSAGRRTYFGPDAESLLDDGFRDGYCFHLSASVRSRPKQVGLAFVPANRRRDRVDIEGALWIDTSARALRDIEFRYLGAESIEPTLRSGGRTSFREMSNGVVLIDQWSLRFQSVAHDTTYARHRTVVQSRLYTRETGGELARAIWPDGSMWEASLGSLNGRVVTRDGTPMGHAIVRLANTDYLASTHDDGTFGMTDLLPGPYTAVYLDTLLTPLGISLHTDFRFTAVRGKSMLANIVGQTADEYVRKFCASMIPKAADPVDEQSAWIIGRVVNGDGNPVNGARVSFIFDEITGSDGLFGYCKGLREKDVVSITVRLADGGKVVREVKVRGGINVVRIVAP